MGQPLAHHLQGALDALTHHLHRQDDLIRELQERLDFFERGYRPRLPEAPPVVAPPIAVAPKRVPLEKAVIVVKALLHEIGAPKTLDVLAECLGVSQSSASKALLLIQRALPHLITSGKSGPRRIFWISKASEQRAREWLSANGGQTAPPVEQPWVVRESAVLATSADGFTLTLPTGQVLRSRRSRDLRYKASKRGYVVEDRTHAAAKEPETPSATVFPLRSVPRT